MSNEDRHQHIDGNDQRGQSCFKTNDNQDRRDELSDDAAVSNKFRKARGSDKIFYMLDVGKHFEDAVKEKDATAGYAH